MKPRLVTREDYPEFASWWTARGSTAPSLSLLPPLGLTVPGVATAYLYITDAPLAIVAWPATRPSASADERREALEAIFNAVDDLSRSHGCTHVLGMTMHQSLSRLFMTHGYRPGDTGVTQFVKELR
jgi:hypothetical protein